MLTFLKRFLFALVSIAIFGAVFALSIVASFVVLAASIAFMLFLRFSRPPTIRRSESNVIEGEYRVIEENERIER